MGVLDLTIGHPSKTLTQNRMHSSSCGNLAKKSRLQPFTAWELNSLRWGTGGGPSYLRLIHPLGSAPGALLVATIRGPGDTAYRGIVKVGMKATWWGLYMCITALCDSSSRNGGFWPGHFRFARVSHQQLPKDHS